MLTMKLLATSAVFLVLCSASLTEACSTWDETVACLNNVANPRVPADYDFLTILREISDANMGIAINWTATDLDEVMTLYCRNASLLANCANLLTTDICGQANASISMSTAYANLARGALLGIADALQYVCKADALQEFIDARRCAYEADNFNARLGIHAMYEDVTNIDPGNYSVGFAHHLADIYSMTLELCDDLENSEILTRFEGLRAYKYVTAFKLLYGSSFKFDLPLDSLWPFPVSDSTEADAETDTADEESDPSCKTKKNKRRRRMCRVKKREQQQKQNQKPKPKPKRG